MNPRQATLLALAAAVLAGCADLSQMARTNGVTPLADGIDNFTAQEKALAGAGSRAVDNISMKDERAIGQAASIRMIASYNGLVSDQDLFAYLNEVGNLVAQQGTRIANPETKHVRTQARRFFFAVLDTSAVGAWSFPGGYIFVTRGLMQDLSSESDLAFVLGHEIAHVDQEHNLKAIKAAVEAKGFAGALLKGGSQASDSGFGDSKFFNAVVDKIFDIRNKLGLDVGQEEEADRIGLQYAIAAGYDAHAAERVIDLLALSPHKQAFLGRGYDPPEKRKALLKEIIDGATPGLIGEKRYDKNGMRHLEAAIAAKGAPP